MPRSGAVRGQPALLARLARLRDGRNRNCGRLCRRPSPNFDFHPGRDRQYRSAQPRQLRSRRAARTRDGPRRVRSSPADSLDCRRTNCRAQNRAEPQAQRSQRRTRHIARLRRPDPGLARQPSRRRRLSVETFARPPCTVPRGAGRSGSPRGAKPPRPTR